MIQEWSKLFTPAIQERLVLLLNHVIAREPVAMARLAAQQGRAIRVHVTGWPGLLPAPPDLLLGVTPAGLLERLEIAPDDALSLGLDASNPAGLALGVLLGQKPAVQVQGDAALAADISWLMDNLRWDVEDDLAKVVGAMPARQLTVWAQSAVQACAALAGSLSKLMPGTRA